MRRGGVRLEDEWNRAWRLAVNQFQLEAMDCRELLHLAYESAHRDRRKREAVDLMSRARDQMAKALGDLERAHRRYLAQLAMMQEGVEHTVAELRDDFRDAMARLVREADSLV
ncbi:hypothetical protein FJZ36_07805 [Candidatus Poribacteria bacterium]|nr:hypothetical protein [Candidatus Poribacteria bacterium]